MSRRFHEQQGSTGVGWYDCEMPLIKRGVLFKVKQGHVYVAVILQRVFIYFPMLSPKYLPRRWGDDFVLFNTFDLNNSNENIWPNSPEQFVDRIRSRRYLTIASRNIYEMFDRSQELTHLFFVILWLITCIIFCSIAIKLFQPTAALVSTLMFGSLPFRFDFFDSLQGVCYILVTLSFIICFRAILSLLDNQNFFKHCLLSVSIVLLNYSSFLLYEVSILATPILALWLLFRSKKMAQKQRIVSVLTFLLLTASSLIHIVIVSTVANPIWNRNPEAQLLPSQLPRQLIEYYFRGLRLFLEPAYDFVLFKDTSHQIKNILLRDSRIFVVFMVMMTYLLIVVFKTFTPPKISQMDLKRSDTSPPISRVEIILVSMGIIASSAVGFITFEGQFPPRLGSIASIGIALLVGVYFEELSKKKSNIFNLQKLALILIIAIYTLSSINGIQSIAKVARFDARIEQSLKRFLDSEDNVGLPIVINLPKPVCQGVNWWSKNPSIWEANSGQLNLAELLGLINGEQGDLALKTYIPRVLEWEDPYFDFTQMSHSCKLQDADNVDFRKSVKPQWDPDYPNSTQIGFDSKLVAYRVLP